MSTRVSRGTAPRTAPVLSIVIPCFNEKDWIEQLVVAVESADTGDVEKQLIIVDDCSNDGTRDILKRYDQRHSTQDG